MITIGLTGGIGSGKSTVAKQFAALGAVVIDADKIVHDALTPHGKAYDRVLKVFGSAILESGLIDRSRLSKIVFQNKSVLKKLTDILYPITYKEIQKRIHNLKKETPLVVIEAPLLIEAGWHRYFDYVIVVKATRLQQIQRTISKKKLSKKEIINRMRFQMPLRQKITMADIVIDNRKSLKETIKQVKFIVERLKTRTPIRNINAGNIKTK